MVSCLKKTPKASTNIKYKQEWLLKTNKTGSFFPRESDSGSTSKLVLCSHSLGDRGSEKNS